MDNSRISLSFQVPCKFSSKGKHDVFLTVNEKNQVRHISCTCAEAGDANARRAIAATGNDETCIGTVDNFLLPIISGEGFVDRSRPSRGTRDGAYTRSEIQNKYGGMPVVRDLLQTLFRTSTEVAGPRENNLASVRRFERSLTQFIQDATENTMLRVSIADHGVDVDEKPAKSLYLWSGPIIVSSRRLANAEDSTWKHSISEETVGVYTKPEYWAVPAAHTYSYIPSSLENLTTKSEHLCGVCGKVFTRVAKHLGSSLHSKKVVEDIRRARRLLSPSGLQAVNKLGKHRFYSKLPDSELYPFTREYWGKVGSLKSIIPDDKDLKFFARWPDKAATEFANWHGMTRLQAYRVLNYVSIMPSDSKHLVAPID